MMPSSNQAIRGLYLRRADGEWPNNIVGTLIGRVPAFQYVSRDSWSLATEFAVDREPTTICFDAPTDIDVSSTREPVDSILRRLAQGIPEWGFAVKPTAFGMPLFLVICDGVAQVGDTPLVVEGDLLVNALSDMADIQAFLEHRRIFKKATAGLVAKLARHGTLRTGLPDTFGDAARRLTIERGFTLPCSLSGSPDDHGAMLVVDDIQGASFVGRYYSDRAVPITPGSELLRWVDYCVPRTNDTIVFSSPVAHIHAVRQAGGAEPFT